MSVTGHFGKLDPSSAETQHWHLPGLETRGFPPLSNSLCFPCLEARPGPNTVGQDESPAMYGRRVVSPVLRSKQAVGTWPSVVEFLTFSIAC